LADFAKSDAVVIAVLGTSVRWPAYGPRLAELAEYESRATFIGLDANRQDALAEMAAYARRGHQVPLLGTPAIPWPTSWPFVRPGCQRRQGSRGALLGPIDDRSGIGYTATSRAQLSRRCGSTRCAGNCGNRID
jgi:hypothetical protein